MRIPVIISVQRGDIFYSISIDVTVIQPNKMS